MTTDLNAFNIFFPSLSHVFIFGIYYRLSLRLCLSVSPSTQTQTQTHAIIYKQFLYVKDNSVSQSIKFSFFFVNFRVRSSAKITVSPLINHSLFPFHPFLQRTFKCKDNGLSTEIRANNRYMTLRFQSNPHAPGRSQHRGFKAILTGEH